MSKIKCCIDCADRKLFCHSSCDKYIKQKALNDANRLMIAETRNKERLYNSFRAERVRKTKKK